MLLRKLFSRFPIFWRKKTFIIKILLKRTSSPIKIAKKLKNFVFSFSYLICLFVCFDEKIFFMSSQLKNFSINLKTSQSKKCQNISFDIFIRCLKEASLLFLSRQRDKLFWCCCHFLNHVRKILFLLSISWERTNASLGDTRTTTYKYTCLVCEESVCVKKCVCVRVIFVCLCEWERVHSHRQSIEWARV